jgi:serine/threonine protein kinase
MLTFPCPRCGVLLQVHEQWAGKPVRCGGCRNVVEAPGAAAARAASRVPADADEPLTLPPGRGQPAPRANGSPPAGPAAGRELYDFLAPPQAAGELGRLGPYRVLKVLGSGGMGVVFQAEHLQLRRPVALKALLPLLAVSPGARERFQREARAAAAVTHDHVVPIYEVGEDRGIPFLAMRLLQGETLEARLRRERKLPVPEVLRIGREVAEGLAAAHDRGLIHRDIKPSNIWLEDRSDGRPACRLSSTGGPPVVTGGRVKLLDFGLARAAGGDAQLTQSGALIGTPGYLAPEQTRGGEPDPRSDLFSLGCVLYRMCTGELPFKGHDTLALLAALATQTPRPVRERNPAVPSALSDLVARLLAKDPVGRPPSARAVVVALAALEQGRAYAPPAPDAEALSDVPLPAPAEPVVLEPAALTDVVVPARRPRSAWVPVVLGASGCGVVALGLLVTGIVFLTWHGHGRQDQPAGPPRPAAVPERKPPQAPFAAIQAAVRAHQYTGTKIVGAGAQEQQFEDVLPEGGILIGFEVGLEGFIDTFVIGYLRPIYLTAEGEKMGQACGRRTGQERTVKAKPGFAVGALKVRSGALLDAFSVTFMEIDRTGLKKDGGYQSEWIGGRGGGEDGPVGGDGAFVVGVHGRLTDGIKPGGLGLVSLQPEPH